MNEPTAQIVALTCYGNALLSGEHISTFFPTNSTCTFCDRVNFATVEKNLAAEPIEQQVAQTPDEWFLLLQSFGARGLQLSRTPHNDPRLSDRMAAAFVGGGGTWAIQVLLPNDQSEYWIARWEVWNRSAPDKRIWRVTYLRVAAGETPVLRFSDVADVTSRFEENLKEIHTFSAKYEWCDGFTQDFAPGGFLPIEATAILDAVQSAWVFGGMGSWNDMGFEGEDEKEYERNRRAVALGADLASAGEGNEYSNIDDDLSGCIYDP